MKNIEKFGSKNIFTGRMVGNFLIDCRARRATQAIVTLIMRFSVPLFIILIILTGCDSILIGKKTNQEALSDELRSTGVVNSSYASALDRHRPVGEVAGDLKPLPYKLEPSSVYSSAVNYARDMGSYGLLIWHRGRLVVEQYYTPYTSEIRPESASMHKSVVALLVMAAISDSLLTADIPIGAYIPEWANDERGGITVRQLLTMSSGLARLSSDGGSASPAARYVYDGEAAREATLALKLRADRERVFEYNDAVTQVLVLVLEAAAQTPYHEYLSQRLWKRLGADDAYVWFNEPNGFARGYTALMARPRDWLRLGLLVKDEGLFDGQRIIDRKVILEGASASAGNSNYGWSMWRGATHAPQRYYNLENTGFSVRASAPFLADDILYFDGFGGQRVYISKSEDLVIVRLGDLRPDWDDAILVNSVLSSFQ